VVRKRLAEREKKKNIPQVLVDMRMQHYEEKRKQKLALIKEVTLKRKILFWKIGTIDNNR
jgi:nucleotidyltransferase/DNA polymerase involved in DNA repair